MVLEKETAFPDFCILHLSRQLPKGSLSWPAGWLPLPPQHIHKDTQITVMMNVFLVILLCDITQSHGLKIQEKIV